MGVQNRTGRDTKLHIQTSLASVFSTLISLVLYLQVGAVIAAAVISPSIPCQDVPFFRSVPFCLPVALSA